MRMREIVLDTVHSTRGHSEILEKFGRDILSMKARCRETWIHKALNYWRERGFPYAKLVEEEIEREFKLIQNTPLREIISAGMIRPTTVGLRLANSFHPQIWHVRSQGHRLAPYEHFHDDIRLRKLLEKAPHFWPDRRCWNAQCLRSLLRMYCGGRVANFRPMAARAVIETYSPERGTVVDFCAGFGGRLLGCAASARHYVGIDPSSAQVAGLRSMYAALNGFSPTTAQIHQACAEDLLPSLPASSADLVFSSPPYFDIECYGTEAIQSALRYPNYTEWRNQFLATVISEAYRILRRGGFFAINVSDTRRWPLFADTLRIAKPLFRTWRTIRMVMNSRPVQRSNGVSLYRWEPIIVFQRRD